MDSIYSEASKVVNEPEAVLRRINHPYRLMVAPQYSTSEGKLDYSKFAAEKDKCVKATTHLDLFPWHIWRVVRHDFETGQSSGKEMSLRELINMVVRDLKVRMQTHDVTRTGLEDYVSRLNELMRKPPVKEESALASRSNYCTELHDLVGKSPVKEESALASRSNYCTDLHEPMEKPPALS